MNSKKITANSQRTHANSKICLTLNILYLYLFKKQPQIHRLIYGYRYTISMMNDV